MFLQKGGTYELTSATGSLSEVCVRSFDDDDGDGDDAGVDGVDAVEPDQAALSICKVDKCSDPPCIGRSFLVGPSPCQTVIMMIKVIITGFWRLYDENGKIVIQPVA